MTITEVTEIELRYPCGKCGAVPGEWCHRVSNGMKAGMLHSSRWRQAVADGVMPWQQEGAGPYD
jgi:hypothetical protein